MNVIVHPEDCVLGIPGDPRDCGHDARVLRRLFQGTATRYTLSWGTATMDAVDLGTTPRFDEGAEISLHIGSDRARIIPA